MDPLAQATNARNLRVYQAAYEQGILAGIEIEPGADACEAVSGWRATYDLWSLPPLPVTGCGNADGCACGYRAEFRDQMQITTR